MEKKIFKKGKVYNLEIKNQFIKEKQDLFYQYSKIFTKSKDLETENKKDLGEFSIKQIKKLLVLLNLKSENSVSVHTNYIKHYIDYCIKNNKTDTQLNILEKRYEFDENWEKNIFNNSVRNDFSYEEIQDYMNKYIQNDQDRVVFQLILDGVSGYQLSEIRNLTKDDIIEEDINGQKRYKLHLNNIDDKGNESTRELSVLPSTVELIKEALDEDEYQKYPKDGLDPRGSVGLKMNEFVVRPSKRSSNEQIGESTLFVRLQNISKYLGFGRLTATNIEKAGKLYLVKSFLENNGELEIEVNGKVVSVIDVIVDRFNVQKNKQSFNHTLMYVREHFPQVYPSNDYPEFNEKVKNYRTRG